MDNQKQSIVLQQQFFTPSFLTKTYDILENSDYNDIIQWNEDGTAFIILKPCDFAKKVLPKYFKHNNYMSFIRQLNLYNFQKNKNEQGKHIFQHIYFQKEKSHLMSEIKRKPIEQQEQLEEQNYQTNYSIKLSMSKLKNDYQYFHNEILAIKAQQLQFQHAIAQFMKQNDYLINQNALLWLEIQKFRDIDDQKIENFSYLIATLMATMNSIEQSPPSQFTSYNQSSSSDISMSQGSQINQSISPLSNQIQLNQNKFIQQTGLKQSQLLLSSKQDISLFDQGLSKKNQNQIKAMEFDAYQNGLDFYQKLMDLSQQYQMEEGQNKFYMNQKI